MRSLCFYLQACLGDSSEVTTFLSAGSTACTEPPFTSSQVTPAVPVSASAAGWAAQGLALAEDPLAVCERCPGQVLRLLQISGSAGECSCREVLLTYAMLLGWWDNSEDNPAGPHPTWDLLLRSDREVLLHYWQSCSPAASASACTLPEAMLAQLLQLARCLDAPDYCATVQRVLCAAQELGQSIAIRSVAGLHAVADALRDAVEETEAAGQTLPLQGWNFFLEMLARLLDASLLLLVGGAEDEEMATGRVCGCAESVLHCARKDVAVSALVQVCTIKLCTTAFYQNIRAGQRAVPAGELTDGRLGTFVEASRRVAHGDTIR